MNNLLAEFDKDVQQSSAMQNIKERMRIRNEGKLSVRTEMADQHGQQQKVLSEDAEINMVVLWASWCGPCRVEIPALKRLRQTFSANKKLRMVSISLDDDRNKWLKAMQQEAMPWEQLWITPEQKPYQQEFLGLMVQYLLQFF